MKEDERMKIKDKDIQYLILIVFTNKLFYNPIVSLSTSSLSNINLVLGRFRVRAFGELFLALVGGMALGLF